MLDGGDEPGLRAALSLLDGLGATATAGLARQRMRECGIRSAR
jgi:hypothetical protein